MQHLWNKCTTVQFTFGGKNPSQQHESPSRQCKRHVTLTFWQNLQDLTKKRCSQIRSRKLTAQPVCWTGQAELTCCSDWTPVWPDSSCLTATLQPMHDVPAWEEVGREERLIVEEVDSSCCTGDESCDVCGFSCSTRTCGSNKWLITLASVINIDVGGVNRMFCCHSQPTLASLNPDEISHRKTNTRNMNLAGSRIYSMWRLGVLCSDYVLFPCFCCSDVRCHTIGNGWQLMSVLHQQCRFLNPTSHSFPYKFIVWLQLNAVLIVWRKVCCEFGSILLSAKV